MTAPAAWVDGGVAALLVVGAVFALAGSLALVRLPDFFLRLHGPSKAGTLGVGCALAGSALWFWARGHAGLGEGWVVLFLFITAPVSAHLLVRAALRLRREPPVAGKESPPPPP